MNAIAVLNLNNYLPDIGRKAFQAAAERWGVDYVEITEPLSSAHHFWQKAQIPLSIHLAKYERVLQLDADMLVSQDCPNPFEIVPENAFGVVSRVQPNRPQRDFRVAYWSRHYCVPGYRDPKQHLNAGLFLYNQIAHAELLRTWQDRAEPGPDKPKCSLPEQFVLSCLLATGMVPVHWLPWQFNACRAQQWSVPRDCYIAHFHAPRKRPLAEIMAGFQFKR